MLDVRALIKAAAMERQGFDEDQSGLAFLCNIVDAVEIKSVEPVLVQGFFLESVKHFNRRRRDTDDLRVAADAAFGDAVKNKRERSRKTARFRWRSRETVDPRFRAVHICERRKLVMRYGLKGYERRASEGSSDPKAIQESADALLEELTERMTAMPPLMLGSEYSIFWATHYAATADCGDRADDLCDLLGIPDDGGIFKFTFRETLADTMALLAEGKLDPIIVRRPTFVEAVDQRFFRHRPDRIYADGWGRAVHLASLMTDQPHFDGAPEVVIGERMMMNQFGDWSYIGETGGTRFIKSADEEDVDRRFHDCVIRGKSWIQVEKKLRDILNK